MKLCALLFIFVYAASTASAFHSYAGHKVYRVHVADVVQMKHILDTFPNVDYWHIPRDLRRNGLDVHLEPHEQNHFESFLRIIKANYTISIDDLQSRILRESIDSIKARIGGIEPRISFDRYLTHDEINAYLDELQEKYPDIVQVQTIGQSYEQRDLKLIKLNANDASKPIILIDGGIHAREWISSAMVLYVINQLVENSDNADLLNGVQWHILPNANPDGYEFSQASDRYWRKTRSRNSGSSCIGTDPNRNFGFHWNEVGASSYPCSETFAGSKAFSEVETSTLRDYASKLENLQMYLTFHSYGAYLLYPWGFTSQLPDDWKQLDDLAQEANDANLKAGGEDWLIGSSTNALYAAAGGSDDYMKGVVGAPYSYTLEMPGDDFVESPRNIIKLVVPVFEMVRVFGSHIASTKAN